MRVLKLSLAALLVAVTSVGTSHAAFLVFDDFNVDVGHFDREPTFSGSTTNLDEDTSTATQTTTDSFEGAGSLELVYNAVTEGASARVRQLSATGVAGDNINFETGPGVDGWIGLALKTTDPGWNVQLWVEPGSEAPVATDHNGGVPKDVIADGQWHVYQWDLDDTTGGPDGWGSIAGIIGGSATVADGNHTIDSVIFRNDSVPASSTILMDWVVRNDSGQIPEPSTFALAGLALAGIACVVRRRTN